MITDIIKILDLVNEEHGDYVKTFDPDHISQYLEALHSQSKLVCLLHHDDAGEPDALYLGVVSSNWHSPEVALTELLLYVRPDKRKGTLAMKLLRAAEKQAKGLGAEYAIGGVTLDINKDKACKFYRACKYEDYGVTFRRDL